MVALKPLDKEIDVGEDKNADGVDEDLDTVEVGFWLKDDEQDGKDKGKDEHLGDDVDGRAELIGHMKQVDGRDAEHELDGKEDAQPAKESVARVYPVHGVYDAVVGNDEVDQVDHSDDQARQPPLGKEIGDGLAHQIIVSGVCH